MPLTIEQAKKAVRDGEVTRRPFEQVWAECDNFIRSEQNLFRDTRGKLFNASAIPPNIRRLRHVYNILAPRFLREVSAYTSLTPGFQVDPAPPASSASGSVEFNDSIQAAVYGERQLMHFWGELHLQQVTARAKYLSVMLGEGYVWTYYDPSKGRPIGNSGKFTGSVQAITISPHQVTWRSGRRFEESDFYDIRCLYSRDEVLGRWPKANPDQLKPDATQADSLSNALLSETSGTTPTLITVHEFFERPTGANPKGRHFIYTSDQILYEGDYPYTFEETNNEPWLVRYHYLQPEGQSRGKGMVQDGLDVQRAYNRRMNQQSEWHSIATNPMPIINRRTADTQDTSTFPGKVWISEPALDQGEPVRFVQPPQLPDWVRSSPDDLSQKLDSITGQYDLNSLASSAAAATVQQIISQDQNRRGEIARGFDDADSRVGRRLLLLARRYYTEPRRIDYSSGAGPNTVQNVVASDVLPKRLNVRITSGAPSTPQQNAQLISQWIAQGLVPGPLGILALQKNAPEIITEPLELNLAKQQRENRQITELSDAVIGPIIQEHANSTAQFIEAGGDVSSAPIPPGPWPRPAPLDNDAIHMQQMENWFLTPEYDLLTPAQKQVALWHYEGHKRQDIQKQMEKQAQQNQMAASLGSQNAAIPSGGKILPSQPSLINQGSGAPQPDQSQAANG